MPSTLNYPGIYIEEVPSPVRTIVAVPTAVAGFVGRAKRGPLNQAIRIHNFTDFERTFGGLWNMSELGYAVQQYFLNGGADAYVVRVVDAATAAAAPATYKLPTPTGNLFVSAKTPGTWSKDLFFTVDHNTRVPLQPDEYNLTVVLKITDPITNEVTVIREEFRNVTGDPNKPRFVQAVVANESNLVTVTGSVPPDRPNPVVDFNTIDTGTPSDGGPLGDTDLAPAGGPASKKGMYALEDAEIVTILVIPPYSEGEKPGAPDIGNAVWSAAVVYAETKRAIVIYDPPAGWKDKAAVDAGKAAVDPFRSKNSVIYWPRILFSDPLKENRPRLFAPAGAIAGLYARIDTNRGVWKAPAGEEAKLLGAQGLQYTLTDQENGDLNPIAINCLRTFPIIGHACWGARTLAGSDSQASEWKYIPVRRTALFIEESLFRASKWIVFEPNDEPLWAQIRLNFGAFMNSLFRQGAFQGQTPKEAYFVKCDSETTTQDDINKGIVNILVGFAPLKPVEFVVIKISQMAGKVPV
jgi:phage tail sheath protein FI